MKALLILLIILLTIYSPIELTNLIIPWLSRGWQFTAEIAIIWTFYLMAIALIGWIIIRKVDEGFLA